MPRAPWPGPVGAGHVVTAWYRDHVDDYDKIANAGADDLRRGRNSAWATDVTVDAAALLRSAGVDEVHTATPGRPRRRPPAPRDDRPGALVVVGTVGLDRARSGCSATSPTS